MKAALIYFMMIVLVWPVVVSSQPSDPVMDSIKTQLPEGASVEAQAKRLIDILLYTTDIEHDLGFYSQQLDSLYHCCIQGRRGDSKYEKSIQIKARLFQGVANIFTKPDQAKTILESTLQDFAGVGDSAFLSINYMYLCQVASAMGDSLAFAYAYEGALHFAPLIKDPYQLCIVYNNVGISCFDFGRFAEATALNFEILDLADKNPTPAILAALPSTYHNIAGTYMRLGDFPNAKLYVEKAIQSAADTKQDASEMLGMAGWILVENKEYQKALDIFQTIVKNQPIQSLNTIASGTYCISICLRDLGDVKKAMPFALKGVELLPLEKHASYGSAAMLELAHCEMESGMPDKSLQHALLAYQTFSKAKNNGGSVEASDLISLIYKEKGNFRKAVEYSELRFQHQEQVERQQSNRQLAFGEFTRDNATKVARRDAEVKAQLEQQRNIRYALFAGLGVLALLAFLLFNRYRYKQRTTRQLEVKNKEVEAARNRAESSEAFKSRFLANMSHEIRTPLHGIAGFTDLLLETSLSEKQQRWLSSIHFSADRLNDVVNDILDISKLEAGEVKLRQVPFSPSRLVSDVYDGLRLKAEHKGIEFKIHVDPQVPEMVLGDPTRLYQILMNLGGNAVKFTEKGYVEIRVRAEINPLSKLTNDISLSFSVMDTGIGIAPGKLATVFESFQQAEEDTTERFGGTGLGLTIARELVRLHQSDIVVRSELGKGTTFSFQILFPIATSSSDGLFSKTDDFFYFTEPIRILLADDNALNREIAVEAVHRHFEKANVIEAVDGQEVIEQLGAGHFDLVLMDMQMPRMSGTDATIYIRTHFTDDRKNIPIIALTASATPDEIEKAIQSGMNRHLGKPFKSRELAKTIAETMNLKSSELPDGPAGQKEVSTSGTNEGKFYDPSFLLDFTEGDKAQMLRYIQKFLDNFPTEIRKIEAALHAGQRDDVYRSVHSFRPQLIFVGLNTAAVLMLDMETGAREGKDLEQIALQLEDVKSILSGLPVASAWMS